MKELLKSIMITVFGIGVVAGALLVYMFSVPWLSRWADNRSDRQATIFRYVRDGCRSLPRPKGCSAGPHPAVCHEWWLKL